MLTVHQVGFDFDVILAPVFIRNVHDKMVDISAIVLSFDLKGVLTGLSVLQKKRNLSLRTNRHRSAATGLIAGHGSDGHGFFRTNQGHGVRKRSIRQLIIINCLGGLASGVFAGNLPCYRNTVFFYGVFHLQGQIRRIVQINHKGDPLAADHGGNCDVIGIGSCTFRHRQSQRTALFQIATATGFRSVGYTQNPATLSVCAGQFQFIGNRTGRKLVILDPK